MNIFSLDIKSQTNLITVFYNAIYKTPFTFASPRQNSTKANSGGQTLCNNSMIFTVSYHFHTNDFPVSVLEFKNYYYNSKTL